jgi:hypothetical protein
MLQRYQAVQWRQQQQQQAQLSKNRITPAITQHPVQSTPLAGVGGVSNTLQGACAYSLENAQCNKAIGAQNRATAIVHGINPDTGQPYPAPVYYPTTSYSNPSMINPATGPSYDPNAINPATGLTPSLQGYAASQAAYLKQKTMTASQGELDNIRVENLFLPGGEDPGVTQAINDRRDRLATCANNPYAVC